jgi:hypothetical protein
LAELVRLGGWGVVGRRGRRSPCGISEGGNDMVVGVHLQKG